MRKFFELKKFKEYYDQNLLEEVTNIVDDPNVMLIDFDQRYLKLPKEIIISTLQSHQRFFPTFQKNDEITKYFLVVSNKKDENNLIKEGIKE